MIIAAALTLIVILLAFIYTPLWLFGMIPVVFAFVEVYGTKRQLLIFQVFIGLLGMFTLIICMAYFHDNRKLSRNILIKRQI